MKPTPKPVICADINRLDQQLGVVWAIHGYLDSIDLDVSVPETIYDELRQLREFIIDVYTKPMEDDNNVN